MGGHSSTVFVGNIPYDATEEQLKGIFAQVGVVSSFRLVYEQSTGKPKGYGFCEYEDAETAMSARRNLNGVEVNGRALRVDLAEHDKPRVQEQTGQTLPAGESGNTRAPSGQSRSGSTHASVLNARSINDRMTTQQVYDLMLQIKQLITDNEAEVRKLLMNDPNTTWALLQGQIMLEFVPADGAGIPGVSTAASAPLGQQVAPGAAMPIPAGAPAAPFPLPVGANVLPPGDPNAPPDGNQLQHLQMLMSLTPSQVEQLPPEERDLVLNFQRTIQSQLSTPGPTPTAPRSMY